MDIRFAELAETERPEPFAGPREMFSRSDRARRVFEPAQRVDLPRSETVSNDCAPRIGG